jgi:hypothetical protein
MDDRIHACLDGELDPSRLTPEETERYRRARAIVEVAGDTLRAGPYRRISAAVMAALPEQAAPKPAMGTRLRLWSERLMKPHRISFSLRPAPALAVALLCTLLLIHPGLRSPAGGSEVVEAPREPTVYVRFELTAEDARSVRLAGTFTGWDPKVELQPAGRGRWSAIVPLVPGIHDYAFVVDGERWVVDPAAPAVSDGFGGENSRLALELAYVR